MQRASPMMSMKMMKKMTMKTRTAPSKSVVFSQPESIFLFRSRGAKNRSAFFSFQKVWYFPSQNRYFKKIDRFLEINFSEMYGFS